MNNGLPTLTSNPFSNEAPAQERPYNEQTENPVFDESMLSPEDKKLVEDYAIQIDLNKSNQILQYGVGAQRKIANFSETALNNVKAKDLSEIGDMLSGIVAELKSFDIKENKKGFLGFFKRSSGKLTAMKAKYTKAEININNICEALERHQMQLLKDIAMLDKLYELNKTYFKDLSMYILAGKRKLAKVQTEELPELKKRSAVSGLPQDAQAVNDLTAICNRFEKKIYDLELTRMISIQMAPQIRLIQGSDAMMAEKIQSTVVNTIPLWKSQMALALGVTHSVQAAKAHREVTNVTNMLLKKKAETLKIATIETAKESERGIVNIDTLRTTNEALISTLDEVMRIQTEGHQKRKEAETELNKIEQELKAKLLELKS